MRTAELRFKIADKQVLPFRLNDKVTTLGRHPENSIVIDNAAISSFHAEIHFQPSAKGYEIIDMDSGDGTRVNGKKIIRQHLENGDTVHFGQVAAELIIQPAGQRANPKRLAPPKKTSLATSSRSAMPTPGRLLVKSMPRGHEPGAQEEPSAKVSATPHKIKKARTPQDKTQADQAKLNIEVQPADKPHKSKQNPRKPQK